MPRPSTPQSFRPQDVGEACPLPTALPPEEADPIARMLAARRIAVVGLSDDPARPSYGIAQYLLSVGKDVVPINPNHARVLGRPCYRSLSAAPGPIDLVNVFRRPEHCAGVVSEAIAAKAKGIKGVWLQSGIRDAEAQRLAEEAGLDFVQDRCIMVEHWHRK